MCAYGLAENVVFVSSQWGDICELDGRVSCGLVRTAGHGIEIRIVDALTGLEVADGMEGEIWIHSQSTCMGYWNRPEISEKVFGASLGGDSTGRTFLRTGDLGKIVTGQLYVTGRLKDMIIVRGANVYPQDIERFVQDLEEHFIRPGGIVAVQAPTAPGEPEGVLIIAEARDRKNVPSDLPRRIRSAVEGTMGVGVTAVCIIAPKSSSKTTSGKVRRRDMLRRWEAGELDTLAQIQTHPGLPPVPEAVEKVKDTPTLLSNARSGPRNEVSLWSAGPSDSPTAAAAEQQHVRIRKTLARLAGLDHVQSQDSVTWQRPLAELGVDSLRAAELVEGINGEFGLELDMESLLSGTDGGTSLTALADTVSSALGLAPELESTAAEQQHVRIREGLARLAGLNDDQRRDNVTWQRPLPELGVDSLRAADTGRFRSQPGLSTGHQPETSRRQPDPAWLTGLNRGLVDRQPGRAWLRALTQGRLTSTTTG